MALIGIEKLVFGVEDLELCKKFWRDFGMAVVDDSPGHGLFATTSNAKVEVRRLDDPALPPALIDGSTARETIWAASDQASLDAIAEDLAKDREVTIDGDGTVHSLDPEGYGIGFRVTERIELADPGTRYNVPGREDRINVLATFYDGATPRHLAHVVFLVSDNEGTAAFYRERLGFRLTDAYTDRGKFLRCDGAIDHHNIFLMHVPGQIGFHHCAFELRDIHEVFGGGLRMNELGWKTHLGPGRHNVTSAYYWYFRNPSGGAAEYGFDTDRLDDAWEPRLIEPTDGAFAEWSLEDGLGRFAGLQRNVKSADAA